MAKKTILIIEDDPGYQDFIQMILSDYDIELYSNIETAEAKLAEKKYDLILCDINLLGMSGFELLESLKKQGKKIPFVFCSGLSDADTQKRATDAGASGFIKKPFQKDQLIGVVTGLLK